MPLATVAAMSLASQAGAVVTVSVDSGNLAAFSYTVNTSARQIRISETWGPATAHVVDLKIEGLPSGRRTWTIFKTVTNNTGVDFKFFSHELLNSDKSASGEGDGLSFAQNGSPVVPRTSTVFDSLFADEFGDREYLRFFDGVLANGATGEFRFGVTATSGAANDPFFLRQSGIVPEPATWAMLIAGFGMVGFAMRRRKAGLASVSA
jgi:hypothetical protein